jgi:hypothetical protein
MTDELVVNEPTITAGEMVWRKDDTGWTFIRRCIEAAQYAATLEQFRVVNVAVCDACDAEHIIHGAREYLEFVARTSDIVLKLQHRERRKQEAEREAAADAELEAGEEISNRKLLISSGDFIAGYVPADYAVYGIFQKRRLYGLTGKTGSGKTGIKLSLAHRLGLGLPIWGRDVEQCRVLYLAGENPDDVQARWIAMAEHCKFDPNTIPVHFTKGQFKISAMIERIRAEVDELGSRRGDDRHGGGVF